MNDIVFIEPAKLDATPFTTSKVIAEATGMNHRRVKDAIRSHERDFLTFGLLGAYQTESSGGRPEEIYKLNEPQATFLLTLLKNTPVVVAFKKELVRQFYAMRKELTENAIAREARKPTRREMTDQIRDCIPESPHKGMYFKHYTDLAYKVALGKTAKQLREERNAPKNANIAEYLTADETAAVKRVEGQIGVLIEMGMDYQQIKSLVTRKLAVVA